MTANASPIGDDLHARTIEWRRHLHANPELSFHEHETSRFVADTLASFGGLEIERPTATSVVARLRSNRPGKVLALRADMDALPIQEETGLPFASRKDGVMHACGHDGHTAMLLAAAHALGERRDELAGELRFVFQHAEEMPPGGARDIVAAGVLDGVDGIVGIHLWSMLEKGKVAAPDGPLLAAADVIRILVHGKGGHAATPHLTVDPIVAAADLVGALQAVVARETDPLKSAVLSVTRFHAGTADNVIPELVELGGTMRAFDPQVREQNRAALDRTIRGICEAHGCSGELEYIDGYAPVLNEPAWAATVREATAKAVGADAVAAMAPIMGGEDFSAYLDVVPGAFFMVGARNEAIDAVFPHHHPRFAVDEDALRIGASVFVQTALDVLGG